MPLGMPTMHNILCRKTDHQLIGCNWSLCWIMDLLTKEWPPCCLFAVLRHEWHLSILCDKDAVSFGTVQPLEPPFYSQSWSSLSPCGLSELKFPLRVTIECHLYVCTQALAETLQRTVPYKSHSLPFSVSACTSSLCNILPWNIPQLWMVLYSWGSIMLHHSWEIVPGRQPVEHGAYCLCFPDLETINPGPCKMPENRCFISLVQFYHCFQKRGILIPVIHQDLKLKSPLIV